MNIRIIRKSENVITRWSGGTTSQVYIYPENASYADRNFIFRLSMANAEMSDSVYTVLPGVKRYLVSLSGESTVVHEKECVHLEPYGTVDCFIGDTHTEAHGAIRDFNLMLKGADGDMSVLREKELYIDPSFDFYALYADDMASLCVYNKTYDLDPGDCILLTELSSEKITFSKGTGRVILCRIKLGQ